MNGMIKRLLKEIYDFGSFIITKRQMLFELSKNDFKSRFSDSYFGSFWAFIQPLVSIMVYWFVFEVGFKSPPIDNVPFTLWFAPAYISWIAFSETVIYTSTCLSEYSYLVKKVNFRISILPIIKIISGIFMHAFFIVFLFVINIIYGKPVDLLWFQCIYYAFAMSILIFGIGMLLSCITIFFRDITYIIQVILQIGFWLTPIFYSANNIPQSIMNILQLNPMYYIITGYRDSFIYGTPFYEHTIMTLYYWIVTTIILALGIYLFNKIRPHFADVL